MYEMCLNGIYYKIEKGYVFMVSDVSYYLMLNYLINFGFVKL